MTEETRCYGYLERWANLLSGFEAHHEVLVTWERPSLEHIPSAERSCAEGVLSRLHTNQTPSCWACCETRTGPDDVRCWGTGAQ